MKRLLLLSLALLVLAAPAGAAPADAASEPGPAVVWMSGRTVHTPDGGEQTLPLPAAHAAYLRLLGKRHGAWIVLDTYANPEKVYSIKGQRVRTVWSHEVDDPGTVYALARGGDEVVHWFTDRGDRTSAVVFDLRGHRVGSRTFRAGELLDAVGDTVLLTVGRHTVSWSPGTAPVAVAPAAAMADAEQDVLFVYDADYDVGPTTLSAPGPPAWTASFQPRLVSPDGAWVAGTTTSGRRLVVRSMADGTRAAASGLRLAGDGAFAWEPDGSLLAEVRSGEGDALMRCAAVGGCRLVTDPVAPGTISFPDQGQFYGDY